MKFEDYEYKRPNLEEIKTKYHLLLKKLSNAEDFDSFKDILSQIKKIRDNFETMVSLVNIRYKINTQDEFYKIEREKIDEISPIIQNLDKEFFKLIVNSKFKEDFKQKYGKNLLEKMQLSLKIINPEIVKLLEEENKLMSEYSKLIGSAKLLFKNKEINLSQISSYFESEDRNIRKEAREVYWKFFSDNEKKFDIIYDKLVKIRHKISLKLGYKNFIGLAYDRQGRNSFNKENVSQLRENLFKTFIPLTKKIRDWQKKSLKLDKLNYYDESVFLNKKIIPKGDTNLKIKNTKKMYSEMGEETKEFFNYMVDNNLLDLMPKYGKREGGFCDFIKNEKSPFIFMNFNDSSNDITTLIHECGHALSEYLNKDKEFLEWNFQGLELAEINSMSMEFFSWPWINLFFEDENEFKFIHLIKSILFIPYGILIDEFQHWIYENPLFAPKQRKLKWRELEKKYLPHRDYKNNEFLEKGNFWYSQLHLFEYPFYYIEYVIAQFCAFQYLLKSLKNFKDSWKDYIKLTKSAIDKGFLESIEIGRLKNPFEEETIKDLTKRLEKLFDKLLKNIESKS